MTRCAKVTEQDIINQLTEISEEVGKYDADIPGTYPGQELGITMSKVCRLLPTCLAMLQGMDQAIIDLCDLARRIRDLYQDLPVMVPSKLMHRNYEEKTKIRKMISQLHISISDTANDVEKGVIKLKKIDAAVDNKKSQTADGERLFVSHSRIAELLSINSNKYDMTKLVWFCDQINRCYRSGAFAGILFIGRAIIDHIPPIFGYRAFDQVVSNYPFERSVKRSLERLQNDLRDIADRHLHCHITSSEVIPGQQQSDFMGPLDVLLGEIVRIFKNIDKSSK